MKPNEKPKYNFNLLHDGEDNNLDEMLKKQQIHNCIYERVCFKETCLHPENPNLCYVKDSYDHNKIQYTDEDLKK